MTSTENKRKELEHILNKANFVKITQAVKALREEVPFNGAIGLLTDYYDNTGNDSIKRIISEFLNDLKDPAKIPEVIEEIKRDHKPETTRMIISSCWQSGLDYSPHLQGFTEIFLTSDYQTAIECFSVIESSCEFLDEEKKITLISLINKALPSLGDDKKLLAGELVSVIGGG